MTHSTPIETWNTERSRLRGMRFPALVGPMVGISHVAFRHLIRHFTPESLDALVFTEMLSTRRLPFEKLDQVDELKIMEDEKNFVPQLLGNEESYIERSIQKLDGLQPWGYDINMGCPARQHLRHNWGVRLLGNQEYAADVVRMTKKHTHLPVSVKMRCGQTEADLDFLIRFTDALEAAGADWITVHARTQLQQHKGSANWQVVADLARYRSIPVIVNGDIQTADDAMTALSEFGMDGVMLGRAATARPWLLWQIASKLGFKEAPSAFAGQSPPSTKEEEGRFFLIAMLRFCELLDYYFESDDRKLRRLRFYVINACKWLEFGHAYYSRCMKSKSIAEVKEMTQHTLDNLDFPMNRRINLL